MKPTLREALRAVLLLLSAPALAAGGLSGTVVRASDKRPVSEVRVTAASPALTEPRSTVKGLRFAGYRMDLDRRKVESPAGVAVELTRTEFDLLAFLVRERERVLRRDEILDAVWGRDVVVDPHTVDNFVSSLKKKLGWNTTSRFAILTVRGVGYRMEIEAA